MRIRLEVQLQLGRGFILLYAHGVVYVGPSGSATNVELCSWKHGRVGVKDENGSRNRHGVRVGALGTVAGNTSTIGMAKRTKRGAAMREVTLIKYTASALCQSCGGEHLRVRMRHTWIIRDLALEWYTRPFNAVRVRDKLNGHGSWSGYMFTRLIPRIHAHTRGVMSCLSREDCPIGVLPRIPAIHMGSSQCVRVTVAASSQGTRTHHGHEDIGRGGIGHAGARVRIMVTKTSAARARGTAKGCRGT